MRLCHMWSKYHNYHLLPTRTNYDVDLSTYFRPFAFLSSRTSSVCVCELRSLLLLSQIYAKLCYSLNNVFPSCIILLNSEPQLLQWQFFCFVTNIATELLASCRWDHCVWQPEDNLRPSWDCPWPACPAVENSWPCHGTLPQLWLWSLLLKSLRWYDQASFQGCSILRFCVLFYGCFYYSFLSFVFYWDIYWDKCFF